MASLMGWIFLLLRALALVCLIHAVIHREWIWAVFLALGVAWGGGSITALFYAVIVLLPSMRGSGTRARQQVKQTVQAGLEAAKPLETRVAEAEADLARSDTLAHRTALAQLQARAGRVAEAQATLTPLLSGIYSDDPSVLLTAAQLDLAQGQPAAAEQKLREAEGQSSASTKTQVLTLLAHAQALQGRPAEAEASYEAAMRAATTEEPRVRYAQFLIEQGRPEEARAVLDAMLQTENSSNALYRRQEREWFELAGRLRRQLRS